MAAIGADPEQLDEVARALDLASGELRRAASGIDARLRTAGWHGADAERFRAEWRSRYRQDLVGRADLLGSLSRSVRRHIGEQRRASESTGPASPVATLPAAPARSTSYEVDAGGSIRILRLDGGLRLTIEELGDLRRVSLTRDVGVGVDLSATRGWTSTVGDVDLGHGASAGVQGSLVGTATETWTVTDDELAGFLLALGTDALVPHGPIDALAAGADLVDRAGDLLGGLVGVDPPDLPDVGVGLPPADRTEHLFGLSGAAGAWATLSLLPSGGTGGGAGASVDARHEVRVGVADGPDGSSAVLEVRTAAAAEVDASAPGLGGTGRSGEVSTLLRVEVPVSDGGVDHDRPVLISRTTHVPDQPAGLSEVTRIAADPELADVMVEPLREAIGRAAAGDVTGAALDVGDVQRLLARVASVDAQTEVTLLETTTDGHVAGDIGVVAVSGTASTTQQRP